MIRSLKIPCRAVWTLENFGVHSGFRAPQLLVQNLKAATRDPEAQGLGNSDFGGKFPHALCTQGSPLEVSGFRV